MRLRFESVHDLAVFPGDWKMPKTNAEANEPCMKEEYKKTYYAVLELKKDYYYKGFNHNEWYNRGYYVIPVYLKAYRWMCGDKIVLIPREFCDLFGKPWPHEPQDVPRDKWWSAGDFKKYWGLAKTTLGYLSGYIEYYELYDDVDEAISRAKELDALMELNDKIDKVKSLISREEGYQDNLKWKIRGLHPTTKRKKLELEIANMTYEKRDQRLRNAYTKKKKLESKAIHYTRYLLA